MSLAQTPWVTFLDSDDQLVPGALADRLKFAMAESRENSTVPTIFGSAWLQQASNKSQWMSKKPVEASAPEEFASGCWFCPGLCIIARRQVFEELVFDETLCRLEDFDLGVRFGLNGGQLVVWGVAGAIIDREDSVLIKDVEDSARRIAEKYRSLQITNQKVWNALCAYLNLELAVANYRQGRWLNSISYLAKSFWHKPRVKLHLSPGWRAEEAQIPGKPDRHRSTSV